jgi:hypothetical protein
MGTILHARSPGYAVRRAIAGGSDANDAVLVAGAGWRLVGNRPAHFLVAGSVVTQSGRKPAVAILYRVGFLHPGHAVRSSREVSENCAARPAPRA